MPSKQKTDTHFDVAMVILSARDPLCYKLNISIKGRHTVLLETQNVPIFPAAPHQLIGIMSIKHKMDPKTNCCHSSGNVGAILCLTTGPAQQVFEWGGGGGGGGLERQTSKDESIRGVRGYAPRKILILIPLKSREMHLKLINEILKYKLSGL